jgi:hypothetical protein
LDAHGDRDAGSFYLLLCNQEPFEGVVGDGEWLRAFRKDAGPWNGEKLVVLSLFDGIGGIWAALTRLGIPFTGYSSEVVSFQLISLQCETRIYGVCFSEVKDEQSCLPRILRKDVSRSQHIGERRGYKP